MNKYRSKKTEVDGIVFHSKKEANRYQELKILERAGIIKDLRMQVKYVLIPSQYEKNVVKGKCIERECAYFADFVYWDVLQDKFVVEDTKGFRTPEYKIKRKLMLFIHGIEIKEI